MKMRTFAVLLGLIGLTTIGAAAQSAPAFQIGAGYTFLPVKFTQNIPANAFGAGDPPTNESNVTKLNMNGWNANVAMNFNSFIGVTTDFDMTRNTQPDTSNFAGTINLYTLMVGPQIYPLGHHKLAPFAHVEFGLVDGSETLSASTFGCGGSIANGPCTVTNASFGYAAGGGLDYMLSSKLGIRVGEFDFEHTSLFSPGPGSGYQSQNFYKVKAGIVMGFGRR